MQIEALERSSENERGGYLWRGELRLWDGQVLMGWYAAADGNVLSKGTMFFVLHAHGEYAEGRWVGLSYDGPIVTGYAALARTADDGPGRDPATHRVEPRPAVNADDPCEVVVTAPDADWLRDLCRQLVEARLASSAHVIFPVASVYRWDGDGA